LPADTATLPCRQPVNRCREGRKGGTVMGFLAWVVLGLIAGLLARFLMPGQAPMGIVITILLGIAGAIVGGFIGSHLFGVAEVTGFDLRSIALAVGGAVLLLFIYGALKRARVL
jgi:uncharacterized membrane protein YeaQ/YmgE (transglycosylase-associated protein family)